MSKEITYEFKCSECGNDQIQEILKDPDYAEEMISDITMEENGRISWLIDYVHVDGGEVSHYECTQCGKVLTNLLHHEITRGDDLPDCPDIQPKR